MIQLQTSLYSNDPAETSLVVTARMLFDEMVALLRERDAEWGSFIRLRGDLRYQVSRIAIAGDQANGFVKGTLPILLGQSQYSGRSDAWIEAPALSLENAASLLVVAWDALSSIWKWSAAVDDAVCSGNKVEFLLELGERSTGCPMALFNRGLGIIAASEGYSKTLVRNSFGELKLPDDRIRGLVEDPSFINAKFTNDIIYRTTGEGRDEELFIGYNYIPEDTVDGIWDARLILMVGKRAGWRERVRLFEAMPYFSQRVFELAFTNQTMTHPLRSQSDAMHSTIRKLISGNGVIDDNLAKNAFDLYGWSVDDMLIALKIDLFEGSMWDTATNYLCSFLEESWPGSCAVPQGQAIIVIVDLSHRNWDSSVDTLMASLAETMSEYAFRVGLGNPFRGIENIRLSCRQAEIALEYGMISDPHFWYHSFDKVSLAYMMSMLKGEFEATQLCHPGVTMLLEHDSEHGTSYVDTLKAYLETHLNATHAAEKLFVHRSSMLRRLERIEKISGIDFDDPDQLLHVILSLRMVCG